MFSKIKEHQVTDESIYKSRRQIMQASALFIGSSLLSSSVEAASESPYKPLNFSKTPIGATLNPTSYGRISSYNNFYEFSLSKDAPAKLATTLQPEPWTIEISGAVEKPLTIDMDKILKNFPLEERIYRFRCVEGWSMVVPWIGFELSYLLKQVKPTSKAKYVKFVTKYDPKMFPEQDSASLFGNIPFPYVEGLRIDEAMHPLTLLSVGLYGKTLPNQNGAPIRLVVPWKYGFKSIKSITKIILTETSIHSTWERANPREYGFYANVNPHVDHPRWSQAKERPLGKFFKQNTLMYNGYEKEVSALYKNMDLRKFF